MSAIRRCLLARSQRRRNWSRRSSTRRRWSIGSSAETMKKIQRRSPKCKAGRARSEPAWRGRLRAAAPEPLAEERDGVDLERPEQIPVDAARTGMRGTRCDDLRRRDEKIDRQVVRQHGDALRDDLERVHRGEDRSGLADLALFTEESVFQVAVPAALADPGTVAPDTDRAAYDEIDGPHLARRDRAAVLAGAADARGERGPFTEPLRVDLDEALLGAQARDRHVENLPLGERKAADRELRRVGVHLHDERAAPHGHLAQELRGVLGGDEVGHAAERAWETRDAVSLHHLPDFLADLRLRHASRRPMRPERTLH